MGTQNWFGAFTCALEPVSKNLKPVWKTFNETCSAPGFPRNSFKETGLEVPKMAEWTHVEHKWDMNSSRDLEQTWDSAATSSDMCEGLASVPNTDQSTLYRTSNDLIRDNRGHNFSYVVLTVIKSLQLSPKACNCLLNTTILLLLLQACVRMCHVHHTIAKQMSRLHCSSHFSSHLIDKQTRMIWRNWPHRPLAMWMHSVKTFWNWFPNKFKVGFVAWCHKIKVIEVVQLCNLVD